MSSVAATAGRFAFDASLTHQSEATIKKIIMSWLVTLPASAFFGIIIFWIFGFNSSTTILENNARLRNISSTLHGGGKVLTGGI